jgi:NitT/TauT family transport system ATP-binding protein
MNVIASAPPQPGMLSEARAVSHDFRLPSGRSLRVLEDIDLAVGPSEIVALLGPSGCGKSTLLRILAGLISPTRGTVLAHGLPLTGLHPGVAIVFQSFALYPWMSVADNVRTVLEARGMRGADIGARVEEMISAVGLAGYGDAYPRELSGGMKQRVGMARALSVEPELLCMDEPFSQVDALTAESLRAQVIDIWASRESNPSSILMVSHDIKEVAFMADRIVVMTSTPGRVRAVVENRMPRPRDYRSPELMRLVDELHDVITGTELPDLPAAAVAAAAAAEVEPLPDAAPEEIIGMIEYLDARGGADELFRIVSETHREFGRVINVVQAAEMLEFVETPRHMVLLTLRGKRFAEGSIEERTRIWRDRLLELGLFQRMVNALARRSDHRLDRDVALESIALAMPEEHFERIFETMVAWAQKGGLFTYDADREQLAAEAPPAPSAES